MNKHISRRVAIIKNYRFNSIFYKNLMLVLLITLIPFFGILGITSYFYDQIYESKEAAYVEEICTTIYEDVDNILKDIRNKVYFLSMDDDVKLFSIGGYSESRLYDLESIKKQIDIFKITSDVIDEIYLYAPSSQMMISSGGFFSYDHFEDQQLIDRWDPDGDRYQFTYSKSKVAGGYKERIDLYYPVKIGSSAQCLFIFCIDGYDLNKKLNYGETISLFITANDIVLFDSTKQFQGKDVLSADFAAVSFEKELVLNKELSPYGVNVAIHMDSTTLSDAMAGVQRFALVFTVIIFILSVLFSFYISRKIYNPFAHILSALEEYAGTDTDQILHKKNELTYILQSISRTVAQKKNAEEELLNRIKLLKKAQAVALQAQINPHFVGNTLETINWMIVEKLGGENDISEMLNCFSKLIHTSLENTDTFVKLSDEVEYVKKYLFIQQKRFKGQFDVVWDIPPELEDCKVIKLILQPIVENAINYGIKPFGGKGLIKIKARKNDNTLFITVNDSGFGLPESKVEEINKSVHGNDIKENNHIGMSNVNQRIVLAFGPEYGVDLSSSIGKGTKVTLRFPYNNE